MSRWRDNERCGAPVCTTGEACQYRELLEGHRSGLIVVGVETGGRFGQEEVDFVDSLAAAKARDSPHIFASVSSSGVETALDALVRGFVGGG